MNLPEVPTSQKRNTHNHFASRSDIIFIRFPTIWTRMYLIFLIKYINKSDVSRQSLFIESHSIRVFRMYSHCEEFEFKNISSAFNPDINEVRNWISIYMKLGAFRSEWVLSQMHKIPPWEHFLQEGKTGDCCVPGWEWGELSENPAWLLEHLAQGIHMVVAEEQSVQALKGSDSESGAIFTM